MNAPDAAPLRAVLDAITSPIFRLDRQGRHTFANLAAARAIGCEPAFAIGRTVAEAGIPRPQADTIAQHVEHVLRTGEPREYEIVAPTPAGEIVFLTRLVPERDASGAVVAVVGIGTDVTAQVRNRVELLESEERYRLLIEGVADFAIFMVDPHGFVVSWNRGAERIKGYTADEIVGKHLSTFYPPEDVQAGRAGRGLEQALNQGRFDDEGWRVRRDGSRFWASVTMTPLRDAQQRLRGFLKVTRDQSARRAAEDALRDSEHRYRKVVEDQTEVVCRFRADGTFTFVNDVYCRTFGKTADELLGRRWHPVVHPDDLAKVEADLAKMSPENPVVHIENRVTDAIGQVRWMEFVNRGFYEPNGALREIQAVGRDVTDRRAAEDARRELEADLRAKEQQRKYEQQLLQAQKLESLGVLAGGIAHDFNNLLTAVLGHASLGRMRLSADDPAIEDLKHIEAAAMRAAELCQQMLAYAGRGQFLVKPVSLNHLTEEMTQLLATVLSKHAVLKYNLLTNLPMVRADATQLRQVVMNLITNASDAIGERSGVITLTTGVIDADQRYLTEIQAGSELQPGRYVYLEVSDTGCGMTDEVRAKIFDPFFSTKFTGRGLGLAAVQGIVRAHHGAIKVYTQPGKGTTFKVLLPALAATGAPERTSLPAATVVGRGRQVLVVDDEEDIRVFARKVLELAGFVVTVATDGRDGVERFAADGATFALVLLDLTMPRLGGADAFREIRRHRPDACVVLTSGFAEEEATSGFAGKGLAGFLRKPFRADELLRMIGAAIGP